LDATPFRLASNAGKAFQGSIILGMGFTFDDFAAKKGTASSLSDMAHIIEQRPESADCVLPYIGGEEVNTDPKHAHRRYVISFGELDAATISQRWPELWEIVQTRARPERQVEKSRKHERIYNEWWKYWNSRYSLYKSIGVLGNALAISRVAPFVKIQQQFDGCARASCAGTEGPDHYDKENLIFTRLPGGLFELRLGTAAEKAKWVQQSKAIDALRTMTSGRQWGVF
jgi:hypothetical protein